MARHVVYTNSNMTSQGSTPCREPEVRFTSRAKIARYDSNTMGTWRPKVLMSVKSEKSNSLQRQQLHNMLTSRIVTRSPRVLMSVYCHTCVTTQILKELHKVQSACIQLNSGLQEWKRGKRSSCTDHLSRHETLLQCGQADETACVSEVWGCSARIA